MRPMRWLPIVLFVSCTKPGTVFIPATLDGSVPDAGGCAMTCSSFGNARNLGPVLAPLVELSGLAASRTQPGVLFGHNDSGDSSRFFALSSSSGTILQEFMVQHASNVDWEDLSLGPCPTGGACLFVADIGDNSFVRSDYAVYVVPEPQVTGGAAMMSVPSTKLPFAYPQDAKHNAEALLVDPATGRPYVLTKESGGQPSLVFRFPLPLTPGVSATLELVGALSVPTTTDLQVTGADASPCGDAILVRMYNRLVLLRANETGFESAFQAMPVSVPVAQEAQGEAVAFAADGRSYFTASETILDPAPLFQSSCR